MAVRVVRVIKKKEIRLFGV